MNALHNQLAYLQQQLEFLTKTLSTLRSQVGERPSEEVANSNQEKEIGLDRYRRLYGRGWHYSRGYTHHNS